MLIYKFHQYKLVMIVEIKPRKIVVVELLARALGIIVLLISRVFGSQRRDPQLISLLGNDDQEQGDVGGGLHLILLFIILLHLEVLVPALVTVTKMQVFEKHNLSKSEHQQHLSVYV